VQTRPLKRPPPGRKGRWVQGGLIIPDAIMWGCVLPGTLGRGAWGLSRRRDLPERKKSILIVDDEVHIVHILRYKLEREGYEVHTAGDGQEAYDLAQTLDPDLIVTDFQMPVLSGFEMCVKLHGSEVTADTPVVMVTARGHKLSPSELMKTNIRQLISKPFGARELLAVIGELLMESGADEHRGDAHAA
jgi:DNA-binding response OmpR family regulator